MNKKEEEGDEYDALFICGRGCECSPSRLYKRVGAVKSDKKLIKSFYGPGAPGRKTEKDDAKK